MLVSLTPSYLVHSQVNSNEKIKAEFKQTYEEESNTVLVEVTTEAIEGYEVTAIQKQEEEKIQGIGNNYTIDENGDYTFTIYYNDISEMEEKIEEKQEYSVSINEIKDKDVINRTDENTSVKSVEPTINTNNARFVTQTEAGFVLDEASGIELKYSFRSDGTAAVHQNYHSTHDNIKKPESFAGVFNIPSTVEYKGATYTVTELGQYATNKWNIEIVLPNTITTIQKYALTGITNAELILPASVSLIGNKMFFSSADNYNKITKQIRIMGAQRIKSISSTHPWYNDLNTVILCDSKEIHTAQVQGLSSGSYEAQQFFYESENKIRFHDENGKHMPELDQTYLAGTPSANTNPAHIKKINGIWTRTGEPLPNIPTNTKGYNAWSPTPNGFLSYSAGNGPESSSNINETFYHLGQKDINFDFFPTWVFGTEAPVDQGNILEKVYDGKETGVKFNTVGAVDNIPGSKYNFKIIGKKGNVTLFEEFPTAKIINREFEKVKNVADSGTYTIESVLTDTQWEESSGGIGFDPGNVPWNTRTIISKDISKTKSTYYLRIKPATAIVNPKTTTSLKWQNQATLPTIELDAGSTDGTITWDVGQTPQIGTNSYNYTYVPKNAYAKNASGKDVANYTNPSVTGTMSITYNGITSIDISPKSPTVSCGGTQQMTANVVGVGSPDLDVTWDISGHTSADTKIDKDGKLTIGADETAGSTILVKATSTYDTSKLATTTVTVLVPTITSITVQATPDKVHRGSESQIDATVIGTNMPPQEVIWSISGNTSADTKIDKDGKLTIGADETAGSTITVKATSTYDTSKSATTTVEVLAPTVTSITVKATPDKVYRGKTSQNAATVAGNGHPSQEVTWSISGNTSADTKIDKDGKLTIGVDETVDSFITVKATSTYDTSKSATTTVEVLAPTVTSITVKATPDKVYRGETSQNAATVVGDGHPSQEVTWSISGNTSADTKIDADGKLTIGADETVGSSIIVKATPTYDISKSGTTAVEVLEPYVTEVKIPFDTLRIASGTQEKITAVVKGVGYPNLDIIWEISGNTSDKTVISNDGELVIDDNEKAGDQIVIKAISKADNTIFSTIKIVVTSTVRFDSLGGSKVPDYTDVEKGTIKEPKKPIFNDYVLKGWYKDKEYQEKWDFDKNIVNENTTLYAKWGTHKIDTEKDSDKTGNIIFDKPKDLDEKLHIDKVSDRLDIDLPELRGVYDIYLLKGNERVEVENEKINITLMLDEEEKGFTYYKVVYINDNGDFVEEYKPVLSDDKNSLSFEATHLSYYGVIGWNDKEPEIIKPVKPNIPTKPSQPETGDATHVVDLMSLLGVSVVVILFGMKKQRENA